MIPQWSLNNLSVIFSKNLWQFLRDCRKIIERLVRPLSAHWEIAERLLKDHFHERLPKDYFEPFQTKFETMETMKFTERSLIGPHSTERRPLKDHRERPQKDIPVRAVGIFNWNQLTFNWIQLTFNRNQLIVTGSSWFQLVVVNF